MEASAHGLCRCPPDMRAQPADTRKEDAVNNLLRLIGNRLIALPIMIFGVTILTFFLMSFSPVDPAYSALGESASPEAISAYREDHGLNDPWIVQYGNFMAGLVQGDMGTYGASQASVGDRIAAALPITLQLTFIGLIIAVALAVLLGVISAVFRDKWPDQIIRVFPSPASPRRRSGWRCS